MRIKLFDVQTRVYEDGKQVWRRPVRPVRRPPRWLLGFGLAALVAAAHPARPAYRYGYARMVCYDAFEQNEGALPCPIWKLPSCPSPKGFG